jgi:anti-sigma B factor antagonist
MEDMMKFESYTRGMYQIIKVEGQNHISDLSELRDLIIGYLHRGQIHVAVNFCDASYIYSGAISVLIDCYKKIKQKGGSLCILEPDPGLFDILETLNINRVINIYVAEDFLPLSLAELEKIKEEKT